MDAIRLQRIEALRDMLNADENDVFASYGLALEYKALNQFDQALILLRRVVLNEPAHLYAYYQLGEILSTLGDEDEAITYLEQGLAKARQLGDLKAAHELQALRDMI